jgi:hypothetical protein
MVHPIILFSISSYVLIYLYIAEYAKAYQRREEEELEVDRE